MLSDGDYLTAEVLAQALRVSSKTVRNQIKILNEELKEYDAQVESKHGTGYRLLIQNPDRVKELEDLMWKQEIEQTAIPNSSEERVRFLIEYLLGAEDYVKLDDLSELLFISKKTLTGNLKEVEEILKTYHLSLSRKPNYGIRLEGKEFNRRLCIAGNQSRRALIMGEAGKDEERAEEIQWIRDCIRECLDEYPFLISNLAYQNLVMHILFAVRRMQSGHYIEETDNGLEKPGDKTACLIAEKIMEGIRERFGVQLSAGEVTYIAIHLEGKKTMIDVESPEDRDENMIINQEISDLVDYMLRSVYDAFRFDFRDDLELRMSLSQHLVPMVVRLQHDMKLTNPLLKEIKERYSLSYTMATTACVVLGYRYHTTVKEDEIAYIALLFALALERKKNKIEKKNILLVCASGRSSAQLMLYRYKTEFGSYINKIDVVDVGRVEEQDFTDIDYIFTTVPIPVKVPVPILEVEHFLNGSDIWAVKRTLLGKNNCSILDIYREDMFLPHMHFENKTQALRALCDYVLEHGYVKNSILESVRAREALAQTAFGNSVAMPHPIEISNEHPFVLVALLDEPLQWLEEGPNKMVQAIFLVSVANNKDYDAQMFYRVTARLMLDEACMKELIRNQTFETLTSLLADVEQAVEEEDI
jgi:lichenan operon transcriptional antiterminator